VERGKKGQKRKDEKTVEDERERTMRSLPHLGGRAIPPFRVGRVPQRRGRVRDCTGHRRRSLRKQKKKKKAIKEKDYSLKKNTKDKVKKPTSITGLLRREKGGG